MVQIDWLNDFSEWPHSVRDELVVESKCFPVFLWINYVSVWKGKQDSSNRYFCSLTNSWCWASKVEMTHTKKALFSLLFRLQVFQLSELCSKKWCPVHRGLMENSNWWQRCTALAPFCAETEIIKSWSSVVTNSTPSKHHSTRISLHCINLSYRSLTATAVSKGKCLFMFQ